MSLDVGVRTAQVIRSLTDKGYKKTTETVVNAIVNSSDSGIIAQRLKELSEEAARLLTLPPPKNRLLDDNAVLRALLADMDDVVASNRVLIDNSGRKLQEGAFNFAQSTNQQLPLFGLGEVERAAISAQWTTVDPEVMRNLVGFVEDANWAKELSKYGDEVIAKIRRYAINGNNAGWGPRRIANAITTHIQGIPGADGFPQSQAENLIRTLQMQSFRSAQTINRVANADILASQIRIAALDDQTCLACIALHGESFPIEERIDDHHRGRCTSIPVVKGRPRSVESGQAWWDGLTPEQQLGKRSGASVRSIQDGATRLPEFVLPYDDKVFGDMLRENSLKGVLGDSAKGFYS